MFVSYSIHNEGYGYLCFDDNETITRIHRFLTGRILNKIRILFASKYSENPVNDIYMHTNGIYRLERWNKPIRDPDEIECLYSCLYDKHGFTNILGFHAA